MSLHPRPRGFTLIELLVVISIIGLLSSIVLASLNNAKTKANDAVRIQSVKSLKTAMELYYNDNNKYPPLGGNGSLVSQLSTYLTPTYIRSIPTILLNSGNNGDYYTSDSPGYGNYGLLVYLQNASQAAPSYGFCVTGVNLTSTWWGGSYPACNF